LTPDSTETAPGRIAPPAAGPAGAIPIRPGLGYVQVLAGALLFGFNASVSKVVLTAGIEPARLAALRCTGPAIGLLLVVGALRPGRLRVPLRDLPALAVLGLTGAALIQWLYFVAIDRLPVGIALLLEFTGPLLVAVYSRVVLRHVVARRVWLALGLALAGLALVAEVWSDAGLDPVGVAAGLGAAACLATFYLLGKHTLERRDPLNLSFWMFVFASLFWAVVQPWSAFDAAVLTERASLLGALDGVSVPVWLALGWVVVLGTLAPYALEVAALRHLTPTTAGVVGMIEPVVAAAVAWLWLDQVLSGPQMAGGVLVLVGVTLVQLVQSVSPPPEVVATPPARAPAA
jgi:drug/metabolite transporter (DMT)-like permease